MTQSLDWARLWAQRTAKTVGDNRELLIELDRQIGDGDHGENLDRGFTSVVRGEGFVQAQDASELLKYVAKSLLSTVGGAAGPLFGSAYLKAAQALADKDLETEELTAADYAAMLEAAVAGVQVRGKATAGEKTMVDALLPAAEAARRASETGDIVATFDAAANAAAAGAQDTKPMKATKGRASYLGERSRGHLDPGAVSTSLILKEAAVAARQVYGTTETAG